MRRVIPQQTIVTCDCCRKEMTKADYKRNGAITIKQDALDYQGAAVANANIRRDDLCDSCLDQLREAIELKETAIREKALQEALKLV